MSKLNKKLITILMGNKKTNLLSIFVLFTIFFLLKFSYIFTFPHHYQYKNIELYSDQPLQEHEEILTKALSLIEHSSIYRDDLEFTILIVTQASAVLDG